MKIRLRKDIKVFKDTYSYDDYDHGYNFFSAKAFKKGDVLDVLGVNYKGYKVGTYYYIFFRDAELLKIKLI